MRTYLPRIYGRLSMYARPRPRFGVDSTRAPRSRAISFVRSVELSMIRISLAACGDNQHGEGVPLAETHDLVLVAHEDDDLLFMQPDLIEAVRRGTGMTSVYITAGNGTHGATAANPRYAGLMAAYGAAASDNAWSCGWIQILGHEVQHCRLEAENVSLVFLAYPVGGFAGYYPLCLLMLWHGYFTCARTVAFRTTVYD